jgi:transcriptional regulator of aromatic amino acid metabolism
MAKYKDEFSFKLLKPIKYQAKTPNGYEFKECVKLILKAPSVRSHYRIGNILQALFTPALFKAQKTMLELANREKTEKEKEEEEKTEKEKEARLAKETEAQRREREIVEEEETNKVLVNFAILSLGKEINDFYDSFEKLLLSESICFLDDNAQFGSTELNLMNNEDFKELTNRYVANFFIVSWMKSLGAK